jgi:hypothetical protein
VEASKARLGFRSHIEELLLHNITCNNVIQTRCRGNVIMYRACLGTLVKSSGTGFQAAMRAPTDKHGLL